VYIDADGLVALHPKQYTGSLTNNPHII